MASTTKRKAKLSAEEAMALLDELSSDITSDSSDSEDSEISAISSIDELLSDARDDNSDDIHSDNGNDIALPVNANVRDQWAWSPNVNKPLERNFTGTPGMNMDITDVSNQLEYFELFFDDTLVNLIVLETNRFADQYIASTNLKFQSRVKRWTPTDSREIRVFIALLILQGVLHKPDVSLYWSKRAIIQTPYFATVMSVNRFTLLMKFLHFVDNATFNPDADNRKLFKLKPVLDYIGDKFSSVYTPERNISIDESLMLWKGRLSWKQFIPIKRDRFGIKSFELCESCSGYIWKFVVYTGKEADTAKKNVNLSTRVVLTLAEDLLDKGYIIFMDNYYSSPDLATKLVQQNTDAVGTLRLNRKGKNISYFDTLI